MKNVLIFYYSLVVETIRQIDKHYYFTVQNNSYIFSPYERPIEEIDALYTLNRELLSYRLPYHSIILNKEQKALTFINGIPYILMQVFVLDHQDRALTPYDVLQVRPIISSNYKMYHSLFRFPWISLWISKIDYIEYQIYHLEKTYPLLQESVSYYIGLGENAISYVQNTLHEKREATSYVVSHKRLKCTNHLVDYYNPMSLILDSPSRDISEYIKSLFLSDMYDMNFIRTFLFQLRYSEREYRLLFGRLLYPSFYFDMYDDILSEKCSEQEIYKITHRSNEYEHFLYDIYLILNSIVSLPPIPWIARAVSF